MTHLKPSDLRLEHQGSMTWARDLAGVIRTAECDAGLRTTEVLRDGGWSGHSEADLAGDLLLHHVCWAPLLDHQGPFRRGVPIYAVILHGRDRGFKGPTGGGGGAPWA